MKIKINTIRKLIREAVLFEMKLEDLKTQAGTNGMVEMDFHTEQAIIDFFRGLNAPTDAKSPVDVIDSETGEIIIGKNDIFYHNHYYRIAHDIPKARQHGPEEPDEWDIDDYDDGEEVTIRNLTPEDYVFGFVDAYDVKKIDLVNVVDDPEYMKEMGYDVDVSVPEEVRRIDGRQLTQKDVQNIERYVKELSAMYPENIKYIAYANVGSPTAEVDYSFV